MKLSPTQHADRLLRVYWALCGTVYVPLRVNLETVDALTIIALEAL